MTVNCILHGDALTQFATLPDESVDCVMTSPPYWSLRDYGNTVESVLGGTPDCVHAWKSPGVRGRSDAGSGIGNKVATDSFQARGGNGSFCPKCGAWKGQLGLEPTFELFVDHLCQVFDEIRRVLKESGTCWVNLGDTYASASNHKADGTASRSDSGRRLRHPRNGTTKLPEKSLCLIPHRFAIEMVNRGWILRNTIIWHKPNCMPSSVKDRFTADFDYLFFFTKSKKYWFERQREAFGQNPNIPHSQRGRVNEEHSGKRQLQKDLPAPFAMPGRNRRSVWRIPVKPFPEAHFATFPEALCETPIHAGCPEFICLKCGKPREKLYEGRSSGAFNIRVRDVQKGRLKHTDRKASNAEVADYDEHGYAGVGKRIYRIFRLRLQRGMETRCRSGSVLWLWDCWRDRAQVKPSFHRN